MSTRLPAAPPFKVEMSRDYTRQTSSFGRLTERDDS